MNQPTYRKWLNRVIIPRAEDGFGPLPPIIVAALRKRMVALAGELAEGVVFANASLPHMGASLAVLPAAKRNDPDFFIGNMIPTCISDDVEAAKAVKVPRPDVRMVNNTMRRPAVELVPLSVTFIPTASWLAKSGATFHHPCKRKFHSAQEVSARCQ